VGYIADHLPQCTAEVTNLWRYTQLHDVVLSEAQGQLYLFTFTLPYIQVMPVY
jgi:hypothetical protein